MVNANNISPKICFLIPSVSSGGIEMYLLRYLRYLPNAENITVLVRSNHKGELYKEYMTTGVDLKFLPLGYVSPFKIWQHYRFYKSKSFDVICDFNANFAGIPMYLARFLKIPKRVAFYRQGSDHFRASFVKNRINKYMNSLVYRNATHILSNSQAALEFFFPYRSSLDTRFKVIFNGINIKEYYLKESKESIRKDLGIPQDAFVIGHIGRLDKAKNHETVLKVFGELQKDGMNSWLVLCGRDTEKLVPRVKELGINQKTKIFGYRKDIPRVLKSLDCFLFPSVTEGQPNALIEAMVAEVPVVASDIPSIKECVPEILHTKLKDPRDVDGLTNEVLELQKGRYPDFFSVIKTKYNQKTNFLVFKKLLDD